VFLKVFLQLVIEVLEVFIYSRVYLHICACLVPGVFFMFIMVYLRVKV